MDSIDTNVVLRFLLNDIPAQTSRAKRVLSTPPIYVSDVVVTEAVFVLENGLGYARQYVASLSLTTIAMWSNGGPKPAIGSFTEP